MTAARNRFPALLLLSLAVNEPALANEHRNSDVTGGTPVTSELRCSLAKAGSLTASDNEHRNSDVTGGTPPSVASDGSSQSTTITRLPPYSAEGYTWPYQDLYQDRQRYGTPLAPLVPHVPNSAFFTPYLREAYLGSNHLGGLQVGFFLGQIRGAPAHNQTNWNYTALQTLMSSTGNLGGTSPTMSTGKGQVFGFSPMAVLYPGATNILNVTGGEINVQVSRGASTAYKSGLQIVATSDDAVQGDIYDAALSISNQGGAIGFRHGILFSAANGQSAISQEGTLLGVKNTALLANGIDLTEATFSNSAFASKGFSVSGSGEIRARDISIEIGRLTPTSYQKLPQCGTANIGSVAYIVDASEPIKQWHQLITAGGGSNQSYVGCFGHGWRAL